MSEEETEQKKCVKTKNEEIENPFLWVLVGFGFYDRMRNMLISFFKKYIRVERMRTTQQRDLLAIDACTHLTWLKKKVFSLRLFVSLLLPFHIVICVYLSCWFWLQIHMLLNLILPTEGCTCTLKWVIVCFIHFFSSVVFIVEWLHVYNRPIHWICSSKYVCAIDPALIHSFFLKY